MFRLCVYSFVTFLLGAPLWAAPSRPMPICGRPKPPGRPRLSVADPASRGMAAVRWWIGGLHIFGLCVYSCNVFGVQLSTWDAFGSQGSRPLTCRWVPLRRIYLPRASPGGHFGFPLAALFECR